MQAQRTVTVYGGNRLDQAREVDPHELAREFVQAMLDGYLKEPCGRGGEWAYRLWLTDMDGQNVSWDQADDDTLIHALRDVVSEASDETRAKLARAVWGED